MKKDPFAIFLLGFFVGAFVIGFSKVQQANTYPCIEAKAKGYQLEHCEDKP